MWTRVFSRDAQHTGLRATFAIGDDLIFDQSLRAALYQMSRSSGQAIFSPLDIDQASLDLNLANNQLPKEELWSYATLATSLRGRIEARAVEASSGEDAKDNLSNMKPNRSSQQLRCESGVRISGSVTSDIDSKRD